MTHCPNCQSALKSDYAFCPECGMSLPAAQDETADGPAPQASVQSVPADDDAPAATTFRVIRLSRGGTGTTPYDISEDGLVVGRDSGDIVIADDPTLSPRHLRLRVDGDTVVAEDAGSLNGHYLRITTPRPITDGDFFVCGDSVFRLGQDTTILDDPRMGLFQPAAEPSLRGTVTRILEDGSDGEVFPLRRFPFVFGREDGVARFPTDRFMSRRHAEIRFESPSLLLVDLASRNGTYIRYNDDLRLHDGDILLIGRQLLRIEVVAP